MKAVIKEERNTPKVADEGGDGGQGNRRGHRRGARRFNHVAGGGSGTTPNAKYPTRNKDLPENRLKRKKEKQKYSPEGYLDV